MTNLKLSPAAQANLDWWLTNPVTQPWRQPIEALVAKGQSEELENAFYQRLEFGTAGIRGQVGLGTARINELMIGLATQGLANYCQAQSADSKQRGIVVGSDTRTSSPTFVALVCQILAANGFRVWRFAAPRQVGMMSLAIRHYQAAAGIYISASHNPPSDNGFKCYWSDGAQVLAPHDQGIIEAVGAVTQILTTETESESTTLIGAEFDELYLQTVLNEGLLSPAERQAKLIYSPFHGTGQYGVLPVLKKAGFEVMTVQEQMSPDGLFPAITGGVPNPQNQESNDLTAALVLAEQADLGISTDPDADRLGLVRPFEQSTAILDGNQTATLLGYFICQRLKEQHKLPTNGFLARTWVTTAILDDIANDFGLKSYQTLVGFKYIGRLIEAHEDQGQEKFIFAGEESYGCLKGSYARDKDASVAALIAGELVAWLKANQRTIDDYLAEIYQRYGYYALQPVDLKFPGASGFQEMQSLMARLRETPTTQIGEWPVSRVIDFAKAEEPTNMLILNLDEAGRTQVIVRPSGTEPKIKLYTSYYASMVKGTSGNAYDQAMSQAQEQSNALKAASQNWLESLR